MRPFLTIAISLGLSACTTPNSIKNLAADTGPFVAQTQSTSSAVQRRFLDQTRLVEQRIGQWKGRGRRAAAAREMPEVLWEIDGTAGGPGSAEARVNLLLLEQVRTYVPSSLEEQTELSQGSKAIPIVSPKLFGLLEAISNGELMDFAALQTWVRATDNALQELNEDADGAKENANELAEPAADGQ